MVGTTKLCCVPFCNGSRSFGAEISYHVFPKGWTQRRRWIRALKVKKSRVNSGKVCSRHFDPEDFRITARKRNLREGTVPSKNLPPLSIVIEDVGWKEPSNHYADPIIAKSSVPAETGDESACNAEEPSTVEAAAAESRLTGSATDTNVLNHHTNGREHTPNPSGSETGAGTGPGVKMVANVSVSGGESGGTGSDKRKQLPPKKWRWTKIPCVVIDDKRLETPQPVRTGEESAVQHSPTSDASQLTKKDHAQTPETGRQDSPAPRTPGPDAEKDRGKTSRTASVAGARTLFVGSNGAITKKLPAISNSKPPSNGDTNSSKTPHASAAGAGTAGIKTIVISARIRRRSGITPKLTQFSNGEATQRYARICLRDAHASGSSATGGRVRAPASSTEPPAKAPRLSSVPPSPSLDTAGEKPRQPRSKSSEQEVGDATFRDGLAGVLPSVKENTCIVKPTVATGLSAAKESLRCEKTGFTKKLSNAGGRPTSETPLAKSEIVRKALGVTVVSASLIVKRVPEKSTVVRRPSALVRPSIAADPDTVVDSGSESDHKQVPIAEESCISEEVKSPKESSNVAKNKELESVLLRKPDAVQKAQGLNVVAASLAKNAGFNGPAEREGASAGVPCTINLRETSRPGKRLSSDSATSPLASARKLDGHSDRPEAKGFTSSSRKAPQHKSPTAPRSDTPMIVVHSEAAHSLLKKSRVQTSKTPRTGDATGGDATAADPVLINNETAPPPIPASVTHQSIISQMNSLQRAQDDLRALQGDYNSTLSLLAQLQSHNLFLERKLQLVRRERRCRKCLEVRPQLSAVATQTEVGGACVSDAGIVTEGFLEARISETGAERVGRGASDTEIGMEKGGGTIHSTVRAESGAREPLTVGEPAGGTWCDIEIKEERMEDS